MKKFKNIILLVCLFFLFSCSKKSKLNDQIVKEDIVKISISSNLSSHKEIIEDKKDIYNIYDFFDVVYNTTDSVTIESNNFNTISLYKEDNSKTELYLFKEEDSYYSAIKIGDLIYKSKDSIYLNQVIKSYLDKVPTYQI